MEQIRVHVTAGGGSLEGPEVRHWHLDEPTDGQVTDSSARVLLRGWAAAPLGTKLHLVLKGNQQTCSYAFSDPRQDVVEHFAGGEPPLAVPLHCGFKREISVLELSGGVRFGFEAHGRIRWVGTVSATVSSVG
jgi:hypothetical protein